MPSLINRVPPGLLSLLGIKSLGVNPTQLAELVQPSIALEQFYFASFAQTIAGSTAAINAVGGYQVAALQAPPGELWVLDSTCIYFPSALLAGTSIRFKLAVSYVPTAQPVYIAPIGASGLATERPALGTDRILILPPNYGVTLICEAIALGTAPTADVNARVTRLAI